MDDWAGGRADGAKTLALDVLPVIHSEMAGRGRSGRPGGGCWADLGTQCKRSRRAITTAAVNVRRNPSLLSSGAVAGKRIREDAGEIHDAIHVLHRIQSATAIGQIAMAPRALAIRRRPGVERGGVPSNGSVDGAHFLQAQMELWQRRRKVQLSLFLYSLFS